MSSSITLQISSGLHKKPGHSSKTLPFNPICDVSFSRSKISKTFAASNINLGGLGTTLKLLKIDKNKRSFVVYSNVEAGPPSPAAGPPSGGAWKSWVIGIVITLVLPIATSKLGSLSYIKDKLYSVLQTVENVAETVERVAEKVEEVAEDMIDDLPEGQLKRAVSAVEHIAERAAQDADKLDNMIDKVQEHEDKLDKLIEKIDEKSKKSKEVKDTKK